jgi:hypothetical protein
MCYCNPNVSRDAEIPYLLYQKIYLLGVTSSHMVYAGDGCCVVGEDFYMLPTNLIYK